MARGSQGDVETACKHADHGHEHHGVTALEMTKWFDTNYHYMVPEFSIEQTFALSSDKPVDVFLEAKALGIHTRPVLIGPFTFLKLGKSLEPGLNPIALLAKLLSVYEELLRKLAAAGADWVQIDEPALVLDLIPNEQEAFKFAYGQLVAAVPGLKIMLNTYFGGLGTNLDTALSLPVHGLHIDLVRTPDQLAAVVEKARPDLVLSLGIIDGRNIWRANLPSILDMIEPVVAKCGAGRIEIAPSCSLLHVPIDVELESALEPDLKSWLAFAAQKMDELATIAGVLAAWPRSAKA